MINYELISHNKECHEYKDELKAFITKLFLNNNAPHLHVPDESFFTRVLKKNVVKIFARENQKIIGFASLKFLTELPDYFLFDHSIRTRFDPIIQETGFIWFNSVSTEYRGQNIGTVLLNKRLEYARKNGLSHFIATVHPDNNPSLKILKNAGLQIIKTCPLFSTQETRHIMCMSDNIPP